MNKPREAVLHNLFPIPVVETLLDEVDLKTLAKISLDMSKSEKSVTKSNRGGWQSKDIKSMIENDLFRPFFVALETEVVRYLKTIKTPPMREGNCNTWINVNGYKDFNLTHTHPIAKVSGVFYIQVPKNSGSLILQHPGSDLVEAYWSAYPKEFSDFNYTSYEVKPQEGKLVLFPGFLRHTVLPNLNKKEKRISISFNFS